MPWCKNSEVSSPTSGERSLNDNVIAKKGKLTVGFGAATETYVSDVTCRENFKSKNFIVRVIFNYAFGNQSLILQARSGNSTLFDMLDTQWNIYPLKINENMHENSAIESRKLAGLNDITSGCRVVFNVKFQFKSIIHANLSDIFFDQACKSIMEAFVREAKKQCT